LELSATTTGLAAAVVLQATSGVLELASADASLYRVFPPIIVEPSALAIAAAQIDFVNSFTLLVDQGALVLAAAEVLFISPGTFTQAPFYRTAVIDAEIRIVQV
jgi:hypothetical protein